MFFLCRSRGVSQQSRQPASWGLGASFLQPAPTIPRYEAVGNDDVLLFVLVPELPSSRVRVGLEATAVPCDSIVCPRYFSKTLLPRKYRASRMAKGGLRCAAFPLCWFIEYAHGVFFLRACVLRCAS